MYRSDRTVISTQYIYISQPRMDLAVCLLSGVTLGHYGPPAAKSGSMIQPQPSHRFFLPTTTTINHPPSSFPPPSSSSATAVVDSTTPTQVSASPSLPCNYSHTPKPGRGQG